MKIKTQKLANPQLDWAVAKALNIEVEIFAGRYVVLKPEGQVYSCKVFAPSLNWAQGGPIIERERISIRPDTTTPDYRAFVIRPPEGLHHRYIGATPLEAAMRCYVAMVLGEEVEVPEKIFSQP